MTSPISSAIQAPPVAQDQPTARSTSEDPKATESQPQAAEATDTVQISSAAENALLEATETAVQTAKEARSGDRQAQRLMVKLEAAKSAH
jgi:hypothetical protein